MCRSVARHRVQWPRAMCFGLICLMMRNQFGTETTSRRIRLSSREIALAVALTLAAIIGLAATIVGTSSVEQIAQPTADNAPSPR